MPGTLICGVYDDVPVFYTELVNCPDWLPLVVVVDGDRFRLDQGEVLAYKRQMDLRYGILSREVRWRSPGGKTIDLKFERFASLADEHILGLRVQITPLIVIASLKFKVASMDILKIKALAIGNESIKVKLNRVSGSIFVPVALALS